MFTPSNFAVLAYAINSTLWAYRTYDTSFATVTSPGFFADAMDGIAKSGDMVMIHAPGGVSLRFLGVDGTAHKLTD